LGRLQICLILEIQEQTNSAEHVEHSGHPSISRRVGHVGICCLIHQDSQVTKHNLAEELELFYRTL